jgi:hypothetical protein
VVYADSITRTERDEKTGDEIDREIPFLKGYTVFNVEQIDDLPAALIGTPRSPPCPSPLRAETQTPDASHLQPRRSPRTIRRDLIKQGVTESHCS